MTDLSNIQFDIYVSPVSGKLDLFKFYHEHEKKIDKEDYFNADIYGYGFEDELDRPLGYAVAWLYDYLEFTLPWRDDGFNMSSYAGDFTDLNIKPYSLTEDDFNLLVQEFPWMEFREVEEAPRFLTNMTGQGRLNI